MTIKAYAKVNLCLKVYKGWAESKHKIDSVMYLYKKFYDVIHIKKAKELYISYKESGHEICLSECLVSKVLHYLHSKYGIDVNYHIKIIKKIPFSAGLGGGSSDAAAVMNYVLKHNDPIQLDLKEIALELGSDIPFFLTCYPMARVKGFGQHVAPIYNWKPEIDIFLPGVVCSTTKVFAALAKDEDYVSRVDVDKLIRSRLNDKIIPVVIRNDLTKYIIQTYPQLQEPYKKFTNQSMFSGAGSSIITIKK